MLRPRMVMIVDATGTSHADSMGRQASEVRAACRCQNCIRSNLCLVATVVDTPLYAGRNTIRVLLKLR